jgi:hypothetical protein
MVVQECGSANKPCRGSVVNILVSVKFFTKHVQVRASSSKDNDHGAAAALKADAKSMWISSSSPQTGTGNTAKYHEYTIEFPGSKTLSVVRLGLSLYSLHLPSYIEIDVNEGKDTSSGASWKTLEKLASADLSEEIVLADFGVRGISTNALRLRLVPKSESVVAIRSISLSVFPDRSEYAGPRDQLIKTRDFLLRCVDNDSDAKSVAWRALFALAHTTGSLALLLRIVDKLLSSRLAHLPTNAVAAAAALVSTLKSRTQHERQARAELEYHPEVFRREQQMSGPSFGPLDALFDRDASSTSGLTFSDDNKSVESVTSGHSYAVLNVGPFSSGKASWTFKLDEDTSSQVCCRLKCGNACFCAARPHAICYAHASFCAVHVFRCCY